MPEAGELVALGAAVQAAAALTGEDAVAIAHRWSTTSGPVHPPLPLDTPTLTRLAATLPLASA